MVDAHHHARRAQHPRRRRRAARRWCPSGRIDTSSTPSDDDGPLTQTFDLTSGNDDRIRSVAADADLATRLVTGDDRVLAAHEVAGVAQPARALVHRRLLRPRGRRRPVQPGPRPPAAGLGRGRADPAVGAARRVRRPHRQPAWPAASDGQAIVSPMTVDSLDQRGRPGLGERTDPHRRRRAAAGPHVDQPSVARQLSRAPARDPRPGRRLPLDGHPDGQPDPTRPPPDAGSARPEGSTWPPRSTRSRCRRARWRSTTRPASDYLDGADARIDDQLGQITTEARRSSR